MITRTDFIKILRRIGNPLRHCDRTTETIIIKFNNGDLWEFIKPTKLGLLQVRKNLMKMDKKDFKNIVSVEFS